MSAKTSAIAPSTAALTASSLVFSITLYGLLRGILAIPIPATWFAVIVGVQMAVLLLGRTILTPLGGCALSLLAVLAGLGFSIFHLFREGFVLPLEGQIGAGIIALAAVLLVLLILAGARFPKSASQEAAPPSGPEVKLEAEAKPDAGLETEPVIEMEIEPVDEAASAASRIDLFEDRLKSAPPEPENGQKTWTRPEGAGEHQFDFMGPAAAEKTRPRRNGEGGSPLDEEAMRMIEEAFVETGMRDGVGEALEDIARLEEGTTDEPKRPEISEDWADLAARELAAGAQGHPSTEPAIGEPTLMAASLPEEPQDLAAVIQQDGGQFSMAPLRRPRYRIIRAGTGENLRTFHCDAGYSSLDLASLQALLAKELSGKEPRIVGLNWFDLDQVEVLVEEAEAEPLAAQPSPAPQAGREEPSQRGSIRYLIFDRKTFTQVGEYVPEGRFPRLDRLALHRLLPQYDFRTFVIEAIRWVGPNEVRIYVRGDEKGKGAPPPPQKPATGEAVAARPRRKAPNT